MLLYIKGRTYISFLILIYVFLSVLFAFCISVQWRITFTFCEEEQDHHTSWWGMLPFNYSVLLINCWCLWLQLVLWVVEVLCYFVCLWQTWKSTHVKKPYYWSNMIYRVMIDANLWYSVSCNCHLVKMINEYIIAQIDGMLTEAALWFHWSPFKLNLKMYFLWSWQFSL